MMAEMTPRQLLALQPTLTTHHPPSDAYFAFVGPWCTEVVVEQDPRNGLFRWRASAFFLVASLVGRPSFAFPVREWAPEMRFEADDILTPLLAGVGIGPISKTYDDTGYHQLRQMTARELELARVPIA